MTGRPPTLASIFDAADRQPCGCLVAAGWTAPCDAHDLADVALEAALDAAIEARAEEAHA